MFGRMPSIQRREVLGLFVAGGLARRAAAAPVPRDTRDAVDHIVIGIADLESGMARFATLTGVRPAIGGSHPGRGTRNALVSLGGRQYAELIAPDPAQAGTKDAYGLSAFSEPRMLMWAASTTDIDALAAELRDTPDPGSRVRLDGRVLLADTHRSRARPRSFLHSVGRRDNPPFDGLAAGLYAGGAVLRVTRPRGDRAGTRRRGNLGPCRVRLRTPPQRHAPDPEGPDRPINHRYGGPSQSTRARCCGA